MVSTDQCLIMETLPPLLLVEMQASRLGPGMRAEVLMEQAEGEGELGLEVSLLFPTLRLAPSI